LCHVVCCRVATERRGGGFTREPVKAAVSTEIEARSEETPHIFIYAVMSTPEAEPITESEPPATQITAEKEIEKSEPTQTAQPVKPTASSSEPRNGDVRIVDGERQIYLLGFGWIKDEGGGSVGTVVGNPGDELTGHKVGIMGDDEPPSRAITTQPAEQPEPTGDVIYIELQPPVTKDSTPPAFKPNGEPLLHRAHTMKATQNNFMCYTYKKRGKEVCSAHYLREQDLVKIVLDDLRRVTHFARQKERLFAEYINQKNSVELRREINTVQKELDTMRRRNTELTALFKRLYEDNVLGRVTSEQFRILSGDYNAEQKELNAAIPVKETQLEKLKASAANVEAFIEKAKRYTDIPELTPKLLRLFIERIDIGERSERYSRTAEQDIRIVYRDVGVMDSVEPMESGEQDFGELTEQAESEQKTA
jgi:hypothetical protein